MPQVFSENSQAKAQGLFGIGLKGIFQAQKIQSLIGRRPLPVT